MNRVMAIQAQHHEVRPISVAVVAVDMVHVCSLLVLWLAANLASAPGLKPYVENLWPKFCQAVSTAARACLTAMFVAIHIGSLAQRFGAHRALAALERVFSFVGLAILFVVGTPVALGKSWAHLFLAACNAQATLKAHDLMDGVVMQAKASGCFRLVSDFVHHRHDRFSGNLDPTWHVVSFAAWVCGMSMYKPRCEARQSF